MNKVVDRWSQGLSAICGWMQIPSTLHAEALAGTGFDGIVLDLQHSPIDIARAVDMLLAIEHGGAEPFVRLQANNPSDAMKLLDMGAYGIIVPMVESAGEAQRFVDALHYPPRGCRSFGPRRPLLRYGQGYVHKARETIVALAMIETRRGLENLDAILDVEGLDGLFIGPADLALALGAEAKPDSEDPVVVDVINTIRTKAHARGRRIGIFCADPAFAKKKLEEGFDLVSIMPDLPTLVSQARRQLGYLRADSLLD